MIGVFNHVLLESLVTNQLKQTEIMQEYQITITVNSKTLRNNYEANSGESSQELSIESLIESEISLDPSLKIKDIANVADTLKIELDLDDARNYLSMCYDDPISDDRIRAVYQRISNKALINDDIYQTIDTVYTDLYLNEKIN